MSRFPVMEQALGRKETTNMMLRGQVHMEEDWSTGKAQVHAGTYSKRCHGVGGAYGSEAGRGLVTVMC